MSKSWYSNAVIYQIYPRSFQDSDGDGIGDIAGIRQRLDYLKNLGIDCIWLSPFYPSPMHDYGYDISDYCDVDPLFGTLDEFDALLSEAHERGIRIMTDLVPNHTSLQHPWFLESKSSKNSPKRDWYIWRDARADGSPPNNWVSVFGGPAWEWDEATQQYYLHSFLTQQPDLNWENPEVKQAMTDVMRFWLDRGVDGFRVDAIDLMGKDYGFEDEPLNPEYGPTHKEYNSLVHLHSRDTGNFFDYLRLMADVVGTYDDRLLVLESYIYYRHRPDLYWEFYKEIDKPYCLPFNFELIFMDWKSSELQMFIDAFQTGLRDNDTPVYVLGNHDQPRFASKVGPAEARAGAVLLFALPGIAQMYNGEEIGLENVDLADEHITDADGRDPYRTPMQWSAEPNAGFTTGTPWLPPADDFAARNVEQQLTDDGSMLNLYTALIKLRHTSSALKTGAYASGPSFPNVVSFSRKSDDEALLTLVNTATKEVPIAGLDGYELILSTDPDTKVFSQALKPSEAVILRKKT